MRAREVPTVAPITTSRSFEGCDEGCDEGESVGLAFVDVEEPLHCAPELDVMAVEIEDIFRIEEIRGKVVEVENAL